MKRLALTVCLALCGAIGVDDTRGEVIFNNTGCDLHIAGGNGLGGFPPDKGRSFGWRLLPAGHWVDLDLDYMVVQYEDGDGSRKLLHPPAEFDGGRRELAIDFSRDFDATVISDVSLPGQTSDDSQALGLNAYSYSTTWAYLQRNGDRCEFRSGGIAGSKLLNVVGLDNNSDAEISLQFRWTAQEPWQNLKLAPRGGYRYWTGNRGPAPEVRFDASFLDGWQEQRWDLNWQSVRLLSSDGNPTSDHALIYRFEADEKGVQLYQR